MPTVIRRTEATFTEKRREIPHAVGWQVQVRTGIWSPPVDLYETDGEYVVRAEAAGIREADLEVVFEEGFLLISGVRLDVPGRRAYHQMEIPFGKFFTAVALPGPVDLDHAQAEYKDGFLTVTLPKARPTQVAIEE
jgi:HSP20 family protein